MKRIILLLYQRLKTATDFTISLFDRQTESTKRAVHVINILKILSIIGNVSHTSDYAHNAHRYLGFLLVSLS